MMLRRLGAIALLLACGAAPATGEVASEECAATPSATVTAAVAAPADSPGGAVPPPAPAPAYADRLRAQTAEVLAGPDFHQRETLRYPVLRDWLRK